MARQPLFTIDLGANGGVLAPTSEKSLLDWLQRERTHWAWLNEEPVIHGPQPAPGVRDHYMSVLSHLEAQVRNGAAADSADVWRAVAQEFINHYTSIDKRPHIIHSTNRMVAGVETLRQSDGAVKAALGLSYGMKNWSLPVGSSLQDIRALVLTAAPELADRSIRASAYDAERRDVLRRLQDRITQHELLLQEMESDRARQEAVRKRRLRAMDRYFGKRLKTEKLRADEMIDGAIRRIDNTRDTYTEFMKLRASVDYWKSKSDEHAQKAGSHRTTLMSLAKRGGGGFAAWLALLAGLFIAFPRLGTFGPLSLVIATATTLFLTLLLWAARILVRLYLSEHHLSVDAEERATLMQTYLAMINEGEAEPSDRALILPAVFRPSSDGIIKDDGAPDVSPAALFARVLDKGAAR